MIRSRLTDFMNKYIFVQCLFIFLPVLFIAIYVFAFMSDVSYSFAIIDTNNKVIELNTNADSLREVSYYEATEDGKYDVILEGSDSYDVDVATGDVIYSLVVRDSNWFEIVTGAGDSLYAISSSIVDSIEKKDDSLIIGVDDSSFEVSSDGYVADVFLDESGKYRVVYNSDDIEDKMLDSLVGIEVLLKSQDGYRLKVSSSYELSMDGVAVNFGTILPTNNIYYDEETKQLVKNISDDFAINLLISSNIATVIFSMIAYIVLLTMLRKRDELSLLKHKIVIYANIFAILILILCVAVTLVIF